MFDKEFVKNCILLCEEYGRIATLKEHEIGVDSYSYIAEIFVDLEIVKSISQINDWDTIQEKYMEFIDQFW